MKIVFIGAGSNSFGRRQVVDILLEDSFKGRNVELCLVDTNEQALDTMYRFAEKVARHVQTDIRIEAALDRRKVLVEADYVLVAIARKRVELWQQDYRIPVSYGFHQIYGENGGPGALFLALRNFEVLLPICRDMEELCPRALLFNFTNPEARILNAIDRLTNVKTIGFCHGVFAGRHRIAKVLERPESEIETVSAGINHLYCFLKVCDKKTGEDLLPEALKRVQEEPSPKEPLVQKVAQVFNVLGYPDDHHLGEFFSFGSEFCGSRWRRAQEFKPVPSRPASPTRKFDLVAYANGTKELDDNVLKPSMEITVPVMADILLKRTSVRASVNVRNDGGYIANLPKEAIVEVPARIDGDGIHPVEVGPLPEPWAAVIRTHLSIQELVTEGYRTRSKGPLLQALALDPCVNSLSKAEQLLDEMLELQKEYIPEFGP